MIVAFTNLEVPAVQQATQTIPVVFVLVSDPVGGGFVKNLARPERNITGFQNFETETGGKWLQLLTEIAPAVRRVGFKFAREPDGGVIVAPNPFNAGNREQIVALVARLRLPAIYPFRHFAQNGGLVSYGFDQVEELRGAAGYVHRILQGEKPANLPVQAPTRYELLINLKAAKALGLDVSLQLQQRADEVIE